MAKTKTTSEANLWLLSKKWDEFAKANNFDGLDSFCQAFSDHLAKVAQEKRQYTFREVWGCTYEDKPRSAIVCAVVNKIPDDWWSREANDISSEEWEFWLMDQNLKPTSFKDYRGVINRAYEKALGRGRVARNPMKGVECPSIKNSITQVDPLTADEAEKLMRRCETIDPEMVPAFALMLFAGVRPDAEDGEISRITLSDIDLEKRIVLVRGKGQENWEKRVIKVSDQLAAWILAYDPGNYPGDWLVLPSRNTRRRREKILEGFRAKGHQDDLLRKTFARYSVTMHGWDETIKQMGHFGPSILQRNYVTRATDEEAAAKFFSIMPSK